MVKVPLFLIALSLVILSCEDSEQTSPGTSRLENPTSKTRSRLNEAESQKTDESRQITRSSADELNALEPAQKHTHLLAMFEEDPQGALRLLAQLEPEFNDETFVAVTDAFTEFFANHSPRAQFEASTTLLNSPTLGTPLILQSVERLSESDPETALEFFNLNSDSAIAAAAMPFIGRALARNAVAPQAEFERFQSDEIAPGLRPILLQSITEVWIEQNFDEAMDYLSTVDPAPELDPTFYSLVQSQVRVSPSGIMTWAESITDEGLRRNAIATAAEQWQITDRESYTQWRQNADLPPDLAEEIPE